MTDSPKVLLIDDDDRVLFGLQELVRHLGYTPITASSGVAGLAALETAVPDAVLLDIAMPGALNGVDTLHVMKLAHPDLPVIMVTGNIDRDVALSTLAAGAFDYVMKPVELDRLREVLTAAEIMSSEHAPPDPS